MREKPKDKERLHHIIEAIDNIGEFTQRKTLKEKISDKLKTMK